MKRLYAAYGSNLNVAAMRERCPNAVIIGTAQLVDTALEYRGSAPRVYLTLTEEKGATTPLGIWAVTESDEEALDSYEIYVRAHWHQHRRFPHLRQQGQSTRR